jgi:hypothetical protein
LRIRQISNKRKRKSSSRRLGKEKMLKRKQRPSSKSLSIGLKRWKKRWLLDLKPSKLLKSNKKNSRKPKSSLKRNRKPSKISKRN